MLYWTKVNDGLQGPFEPAELLRLPGISGDTMVCPAPKLDAWVKLSDVPELALLLEMKGSCSELAERNKRMEERVRRQEKDYQDAAGKLNDTVAGLRSELEQRRSDLERTSARLASQNMETETIQSRLRELKSEYLKMQRDSAAEQAGLRIGREQIDEELARKEDELRKIKEQFQQASEKGEELRKQLKQNARGSEGDRKELWHLEKQWLDVSQKNQLLREAKAELEEEIKKSGQAQERSARENEVLRRRLDEVKKELRRMHAQAKHSEKQAEAMREALETRESEVELLRKETIHQREHARESQGRLMEQRERDVSSKEVELDRLREEANREVEQAREIRERLQNELEMLRQESIRQAEYAREIQQRLELELKEAVAAKDNEVALLRKEASHQTQHAQEIQKRFETELSSLHTLADEKEKRVRQIRAELEENKEGSLKTESELRRLQKRSTLGEEESRDEIAFLTKQLEKQRQRGEQGEKGLQDSLIEIARLSEVEDELRSALDGMKRALVQKESRLEMMEARLAEMRGVREKTSEATRQAGLGSAYGQGPAAPPAPQRGGPPARPGPSGGGGGAGPPGGVEDRLERVEGLYRSVSKSVSSLARKSPDVRAPLPSAPPAPAPPAPGPHRATLVYMLWGFWAALVLGLAWYLASLLLLSHGRALAPEAIPHPAQESLMPIPDLEPPTLPPVPESVALPPTDIPEAEPPAPEPKRKPKSPAKEEANKKPATPRPKPNKPEPKAPPEPRPLPGFPGITE
ncbi:MAG: hypothetical protein ABII00_00635 [Elusimicrobiota bacterium]